MEQVMQAFCPWPRPPLLSIERQPRGPWRDIYLH